VHRTSRFTGFQGTIIHSPRAVFLTNAATVAGDNVVDNCSSRRRRMRISPGFLYKDLHWPLMDAIRDMRHGFICAASNSVGFVND
jgi:hypothetical protein